MNKWKSALDIRKIVLALMLMMTKLLRNCRRHVVLLHCLHASRGNVVGKLHISGAICKKLVSFRGTRVSPPFSWCLTRKWTRQLNSLRSLNDTVRYLFAVPDTVQIFIVSHVRKSQILFGKNKWGARVGMVLRKVYERLGDETSKRTRALAFSEVYVSFIEQPHFYF